MIIKIKKTRGNSGYYKYKNCEIIDGYYIVDINIMSKNSPIKFLYTCDYCSSEYFTDIRTYFSTKENKYNNKMACSKCKGKRLKEVNLFKYGEDNVMKVEKHKKTLSNNNIKKYGVENSFQREDVKEKIRQTNLKKYGVDNPMKNKEISKKSKINSIFTQTKNKTINTSKQQIYIHNLIGGILNYQIDTLSLDIAFPDDFIYLEYNGGGHNLSVKIGRESESEFKTREIKRYLFLKSKGWKQIEINSPCDFLPKEDILKREITNAIFYLKNNETNHFIIDIPTVNFDEKYGELFKINNIKKTIKRND